MIIKNIDDKSFYTPIKETHKGWIFLTAVSTVVVYFSWFHWLPALLGEHVLFSTMFGDIMGASFVGVSLVSGVAAARAEKTAEKYTTYLASFRQADLVMGFRSVELSAESRKFIQEVLNKRYVGWSFE